MEEKVIDLRIPDKERDDDGQRTACLVFKLNHTMPGLAQRSTMPCFTNCFRTTSAKAAW